MDGTYIHADDRLALNLRQVNVVNGGDNQSINQFSPDVCVCLTVAIFNRFWWNLAQTSGTWNQRILSLGV